ncbi:hypothetical protein MD484_g6969, partial [Candolleomyces efflorescens]
MSDEEQEYEVESIQEAVVEKKRGKNGQLFWQFRVRWKGYSAEDDTWEPIESFEESGQIVDEFWSRTKDERDVRDLKKFRVGERFLPLGPPKKLKRKKSTVKAVSHQDAVKPTPEPSRPACDTNSLSILPLSITPPPPTKRRRGVLETGTEERASKRQRDSVAAKANGNGNTPSKTPATSRSNLELTSSSRRQSARRRKPSPEVIPDSDEEVAQFMKVDDDLDSEDGIGSPPGSTDPAAFDPLFDEDPEPQVPPHRLKEKNSLVKTFEEPSLLAPPGQLSAKSRALSTTRKGSGSSGRKGNASSSTNQRPGPGRSSGGMVKKPVASLLTAAKGALKSIKGSYRPQVKQGQAQTQGDQDVLSGAEEAAPPSIESVVPQEPPTAEELLTLAGFDKQDAEGLPDFEDSGASTDTQVGDTKDSVIARERAENLQKAKESLFPTSAVSSDLPSAKWNFPTIFGPLAFEFYLTHGRRTRSPEELTVLP